MILHKEDFEAIRDLIREEVKALLQPVDTKPVKPEPAKKEEKK